MTTGGKIAVAALTGTAVGLLTGILVAPASGRETRKAIGSKYRDVTGSIADKKDELVGRFQNLKNRLANAGTELAGEVREELMKEISTLENRLNSGIPKAVKAELNGSGKKA